MEAVILGTNFASANEIDNKCKRHHSSKHQLDSTTTKHIYNPTTQLHDISPDHDQLLRQHDYNFDFWTRQKVMLLVE